MSRLVLAGVVWAGLAGHAAAQSETATPNWLMIASGSLVQSDGYDNLGFGALSLERQSGGHRFGASLGVSDGERAVAQVNSAIGETGLQGGVWWGAAAGDYDFKVRADISEQTIDGRIDRVSAPDLVVDGDVMSERIAVSVSRTFGGAHTLTPSFTLSYDRSESETIVSQSGGATLVFSEEAAGLTGIVALDATVTASAHLAWLAGGAFIATDDAAAQGFAVRGGGAPTQREADGASQWGEVYVGAEIATSARTFISATLSSTIGRDDEEALFSAALGWRF